MNNKIIAGIDLGTEKIKIVVIEVDLETGKKRIVAKAEEKSLNTIKQGAIKEPELLVKLLKNLIAKIKEKRMIHPTDYAIACDGVNIAISKTISEINIRNSDKIVTDIELELLEKRAKSKIFDETPYLKNYKTLIIERTKSFIDNQEIINNNPEDLKGNKLKGEFISILANKQFINDIIDIFEILDIDLDITNFYPTPLSFKQTLIPKEYSIPGCAIVDIGSSSTKISIFEEDYISNYKTLKFGSSNITNNIATHFQIPIIQAEQLKIGALANASISSLQLKKVIEKSYKELFKEINSYLKDISMHNILPGGIIFSGGGTKNAVLEDIAKSVFSIPVHTNIYLQSEYIKKLHTHNLLNAYSVAHLHALSSYDDKSEGLFTKILEKIKSFLP